MKKNYIVFLPVMLFITNVLFGQYGNLDANFAKGGRVLTAFGKYNSDAKGVVVQPDGKIIAAGDAYNYNSSYSQFALVRYNRDGSLDDTFGSKGKVTSRFLGIQLFFHDMALQAEGKMTIAGVG